MILPASTTPSPGSLAEAKKPQLTPRQRRARVAYPPAEEYTTRALLKAFHSVLPDWAVDSEEGASSTKARDAGETSHDSVDLQYCDYDEIDWERAEHPGCLTNAYINRKALIRKSYLSTTLAHRLSKRPGSVLATAVPSTHPFQIAHADELDELFYDELYDVSQSLEREQEGLTPDEDERSPKHHGQHTWWILKPAMADKGQGIRLFNSKEQLQAIFEDFEDDSDDEDEGGELEDDRDQQGGSTAASSTKVRLSQMRDWVIQQYIDGPLIVDPNSLRGEPSAASSELGQQGGRKFHLRVYVLAVGALKAYVSTEILALFASKPYRHPSLDAVAHDSDRECGADEDRDMVDLTAHLTNTCLQTEEEAESSVFLLSDLVGATFKDPSSSPSSHHPDDKGCLSQTQVDQIITKIGEIMGETFRAGLGMPNHFSATENAFEVFGVDFLLSTPSDLSNEATPIPVHLLEINACPDFRQTGARLHGIIERLFDGVLRLAVVPFFCGDREGVAERTEGEAEAEEVKQPLGDLESWRVGERRGTWLKCADEVVTVSGMPW